ncbi:hypothetical protein GI482_00330 [Bacillus sp. N3536]|nr:hypothetical protein GI482_00330 [Bacillus sp. N3536]
MKVITQELKDILYENNLIDEIKEINKITLYFNDKCIKEFDAHAYEHIIISKLNFFKVININRMKFLTDAYITELNHLNPLSCNIILRSIMETASQVTYLFKTLLYLNENYEGEDLLHKLEELPEKLSFGEKKDPKMQEAVNVLTTIKSLNIFNKNHYFNNSALNFEDVYSNLSEIAHPNFGGYSINMIKVSESTMRILDENRTFYEDDYQVKTYIEINKLYRAAINYTEFIVDGL